MIDIDKYENHDMIRIAKQLLIEDAPLILEELIKYKKLYEYRVARTRENWAEIERLREQLRLAKEWVANEHLNCLSTMDIFTEYIGGEEE
jgi:hypothetical protein